MVVLRWPRWHRLFRQRRLGWCWMPMTTWWFVLFLFSVFCGCQKWNVCKCQNDVITGLASLSAGLKTRAAPIRMDESRAIVRGNVSLYSYSNPYFDIVQNTDCEQNIESSIVKRALQRLAFESILLLAIQRHDII